MAALALALAGCSHAEKEPGAAPVDVNAAAARGQSDIDNYFATRGIRKRAPPAPTPPALTAATAARRYGALLDAGRYGEAWRMWAGDGRASGLSERAFAARYARFARVRVDPEVPAPSTGEEARVPVVLHATLASGRRLDFGGAITLRREAAGDPGREGGWRILAASGV